MTLFLSDLDGTLLDDNSSLSPATRKMLNKAIEEGALFSIATARTPSTVSKIFEGVDVSIPFIVMTGAALWDPVSGNFFNCKTISPEESAKILSILQDLQLPSFVYTFRENKIHIFHTGQMSSLEEQFVKERCNSKYKSFHIPPSGTTPNLESQLENVALFYVMQPIARVQEAYEMIRKHCHCYAVFYHDIFGEEIGLMEIFAHDVSKASAMKQLKHLVHADKVVAFGDNINDLPMLREADVAVAVENARPELKAIADIVIGPNTSDSVARYILSQVSEHKPASNPSC